MKLASWLVKAAVVSSLLLALPAQAGDPFRKNNPRPIGDRTEAAFNQLFRQGNYPLARETLLAGAATETTDPLLPAMLASIAYVNRTWDEMALYAKQTIDRAEALVAKDPVRGELYLSVGHFLEGAYTYEKRKNVVGAISKLQTVLEHLDAAAAADAKDPELNLIKGYLDLFLAVNLPYSSPEKAITKLQTNAAPEYLVQWGIAIAYRDLKQYPEALSYTEAALAEAGENPELLYLKGQLLRKLGRRADALPENQRLWNQALAYFDQALAKNAQLPSSVIQPIERERRKLSEEMAKLPALPVADEPLPQQPVAPQTEPARPSPALNPL